MLVESVPTYVERQSPGGYSQRGLRTSLYRPGLYQVRAVLEYRDAAGQLGTFVSDPAALLVPVR